MSLGEMTRARTIPRYQSALDWLSEHGVYVALIALLAFNFVFTKRFLEIDNIRLQVVQVVPVAIIASVGSNTSVSRPWAMTRASPRPPTRRASVATIGWIW